MIDWSQPLILEGNKVKLIPLSNEYREELIEAATDGQLWNLWFTSVPSEDTIDRYIADAMSQWEQHESIPFVIINKNTNMAIGSTRFMNIDEVHRRLEIGHTWYSRSSHRTGVNTECKYLLLRYAFEIYQCIAVEFRTHRFNTASRNAILRLGATQDGIIRNHKYDKTGNLRDTVIFSIINSEWPVVKQSLHHKMNQPYI